MNGNVSAIAAAVRAQGHDFLTWADWYPGGHPEHRWTKLVQQSFPSARHWVHHSVTSSATSPASAARTINNIGIARFGKMSYPFLIHRSGAIIQGCFPYIGAHTLNFNSTSLAGCNIGNYETEGPSPALLTANVVLIRALVDTGHLPDPPPSFEIQGHRDSPAAQTACPGQLLYDRIPLIRAGVFAPPAPQPIPIVPTEESEMFLAQQEADPRVYLFEPSRYTHIKTPEDRDALIAANENLVKVAVLTKATMDQLKEGRTLHA